MKKRKNIDSDEKRIRKDERKRVRKRKRAKGTLLGALILALLFFILLGAGYIGLNPFGFFSDGSGNYSVRQPQNVSETVYEDNGEVTEEVNEPSMSKDEIIVEEAKYIYVDAVYDLDGIKKVIEILENDGRPLKLIDKLATSKAFDDVERILVDHGFEYDIVEMYE